MATVGQYSYKRMGNGWKIYRTEHNHYIGFTASPVIGEPKYFNREEVRRRVYELNGWKYTPRKEQQ